MITYIQVNMCKYGTSIMFVNRNKYVNEFIYKFSTGGSGRVVTRPNENRCTIH